MREANEGSHGIAPLPLAVTHRTAWHRELTILTTVDGAKVSQSWVNFTAGAAGSRKQAGAQQGKIRAASPRGWRFLPAGPGPLQPPALR